MPSRPNVDHIEDVLEMVDIAVSAAFTSFFS